jgi:hypothetical protein
LNQRAGKDKVGGRGMVFFISYRKTYGGTKLQSSLRKTFFAVHQDHPSTEEIERLVDHVSQGKFAKSSIELQRCIGFDAEQLTKAGVTVYRFNATCKEYASS